ncbi:MAG TPA: nitroreductase family protein [Ideonella sp.]|nr:nitroreductase family protein [Ideonella sp.]
MAALATRYSVGPKYLVEPAPTDAELARAVALALRAPDHGGLKPFRFVQVMADQRDALAALFAEGARRRGMGADEIERARERAHNGPALLALVFRGREGVPGVPIREQWASAGGALMNLLNALHLMGYGAKTLSGASVDDPPVRETFCSEGESLLCWIVCGTPSERPKPRYAPDPSQALQRWAGPAK